jgi:hypothetical protein
MFREMLAKFDVGKMKNIGVLIKAAQHQNLSMLQLLLETRIHIN